MDDSVIKVMSEAMAWEGILDGETPPDIVRAPDSAFKDLHDYPFAPNYLEWQGMRIHYVDEGPRHAPVALLLHGQPTWSYLYRRMIPPLVAAGYRCIAPDYPGFGKSDKPTTDAWYVIERHVEAIRHLIDTLELNHVTLFVQDWGGPIGLRQAVDLPDRFDRLVILNTWLHHPGFEYNLAIRLWRRAFESPFWRIWTKGDLPLEEIMRFAVQRTGDHKGAAAAGYAAPYPDRFSKAGPRRFPWCLPFDEPEAGNAEDQTRCFEALKHWNKPAHFIFGDADMIFTADWGRAWSNMIEGATFDTVPGGHFVQEDNSEAVVEVFLSRARPAK